MHISKRKYTENQEIILDAKFDFRFGEAAEVMSVYQNNPTIAAVDLLGPEVLPYGLPWHQRLALKVAWEKPNVIQVWTRGGGKTWFDAMYAALSAMLFPNEKVGLFSASFRQAKFIWAELEKMYQNSPILQEFAIKRPMAPPDKCYLHLKNGSIIDALPLGDGQKIRGARYFRIVGDEAAQIPDDVLDIVIRGMTATSKNPVEAAHRMQKQRELIRKGLLKEEDLIHGASNKTLLTSTAFFRFNHLWKRVCLFENEIKSPDNAHLNPEILVDNYEGTKIMWNDERALIMFDYKDPPEGFMNMDSIKESKLKMSEAKFKMEYCAYFPPDSEGFFRRSKLERARDHEKFTIETKGDPGFNYVLGIDVARKSDNFAIAIGKIVDNKLYLVRVITLNSKSFSDMHDCIRRVLETYNVVHICMDTGGGGTTLEDMLEDSRLVPAGQHPIYDSINNSEKEEMTGLHILDMVKFSDDSIPNMAHNMQAYLDHRKLLLPCMPSRFYKLSDNMPTNMQEIVADKIAEGEAEYPEIEEFLEETTSIIATATRTGKMHLGLPSEIVNNNSRKELTDGLRAPRKDRWTAGMLCCWAHHRHQNVDKYVNNDEPAYGFALKF